MPERPATFWSVAVLIALLFLVTNLPWTLDDYDQAKQAFTSFEMVEQGHWFYQHTPNERVATKPPLVGWISAALYAVSRSWDLAWRLPSLLAAAGLAFLLVRAAKRAYGAAAGLIALSAFGLNLLTPRLAGLVRTDMALALVVFLIGLRIWQKVRSGERWSGRDQVVIFALLTAAMLIKGPIVYAFLLPGMILFAWWKGGDVWAGWWPWIASLLVFAAWVAGGIAMMPGFYEQVVLKEFAGRFDDSVHRAQPFYFYLPHLLHKFAPWSVLLLALALSGRGAPRSMSAESAWLLCWALGGLLVMSFIPSKRVDRIYPVVPPLCLLLAAQTARLTSNECRWTTLTLAVAAVFTTGYAAQRVIGSYRAGDGALAKFGTQVRQAAAAKGWRYEVVGGRDEGLLLYLRKVRFLKPEEAIERWNAGALDALVVAVEPASRPLQQLPGAEVSELTASVTVNRERRHYILVTRPGS